MVPLGEVRFPFDAALRDGRDLGAVPVERTAHGALIEERYVIDPHGIVEAHVLDLDSGFEITHRLGGRG